MRKSYINCIDGDVALAKWCRDNSIPALLQYEYKRWTTKSFILEDFDPIFHVPFVAIIREQDEMIVRLWFGADGCE